MNPTVDWQTDVPGSATIYQGVPNAARVISLPFLAFGGYLGYHFIGGLLQPGELTWAGWTLLPLVMVASLVPGWMLFAGRRRTRVDASRREVVSEVDYRLYTHRKSTAVPSGSVVMLRYERGSSSSNNYLIHVYVETPEERLSELAFFAEKQKTEAIAFATKAASFLSLPMQERLFEHGDVTSGGVVVDELSEDEAD